MTHVSLIRYAFFNLCLLNVFCFFVFVECKNVFTDMPILAGTGGGGDAPTDELSEMDSVLF